MKLAPLALVCVALALTACRTTAVTPTLPPMDYNGTSRPAAAIENTEVMDQSFNNAAKGIK